jgi:3'-phosphoadenosine 5'-phosphosulfate sulfotransferase (PAPS reductase)/FAD synthetase
MRPSVARRDEEKSRAKERIFSFRSANHRWDPKKQRPELWNLYTARKAKGESIRVFPISNWTELDIWVESEAKTLPEVIQEMLLTTTSERQGRAIDHDQAASMEKEKQEGYF